MSRPEDASRVGRVSGSETRALARRGPQAARSSRKAMRARLQCAAARVDKPAGKAKTAPKRRKRLRKDAAKLRAKLTASFLRTCTCARLMPARIRTTKKVTPTATMTIATAMLDTHAASPHPTSACVSIWTLRPGLQPAALTSIQNSSFSRKSKGWRASRETLTEPKTAQEGHGRERGMDTTDKPQLVEHIHKSLTLTV